MKDWHNSMKYGQEQIVYHRVEPTYSKTKMQNKRTQGNTNGKGLKHGDSEKRCEDIEGEEEDSGDDDDSGLSDDDVDDPVEVSDG